MKIYILAARRANTRTKETLTSLSKYLASRGHIVNDQKLKNDLESKPEYNESELSTYHKDMLNSIKQCDVVIVEISTKSSGLGYQIAVALNERKPILAVYNGSARDHSSLALKSNPSKLLELRNYEDNLNEIAEEFLQRAKEKIDTKFILIISPEIDKYLGWVAEERRMHKAQIVRNAVEEAMNKDKDYKQFLKETGMAA